MKERAQLKAELLDAQGKRVHAIPGSFTSEADFSLQKPGIYFLKLEVNGRQITKKLLQQ